MLRCRFLLSLQKGSNIGVLGHRKQSVQSQQCAVLYLITAVTVYCLICDYMNRIALLTLAFLLSAKTVCAADTTKLYNPAANVAPVMIWVTNADGYCTYINKRPARPNGVMRSLSSTGNCLL